MLSEAMGDRAFDYDLFVIGGGSGGVRAARSAAKAGARVGLAEESRMGGTCVIRGCVPKKLMVYASEFAAIPKDADAFGWHFGQVDFSWSRFQANLSQELARLEAIYESLLAQSGVAIHPFRASLADPHTVLLSSGQQFTAKRILIATGGRPIRPDIAGQELAIVSDDLFTLHELPRSILIIGGGYIACEFASLLSGLGVDVTLYCRGNRVLRGFDLEAVEMVTEAMQAKGVKIRTEIELRGIERSKTRTSTDASAAERLRVTDSFGVAKVFDSVLFATGRRPNSNALGLEEIGVKLGSRGHIAVAGDNQTDVAGIYAVGDVIGGAELTPVAIRDADAFVNRVFRQQADNQESTLIPSAAFTRPELAGVGLTEEVAAQREAVDVYSTRFRPMQAAFAGSNDTAFMKLIVSRSSRRVLGCHVVGPAAAEIVQVAAVAMGSGATKDDFDRTLAIHPSLSEELVTMAEPKRRIDLNVVAS